MCDDETAIRKVVEQWMAATKAGDVDAVLNLMTDDVIFMTPGREPFGKDAFRAQSEGLSGVQMDGRAEVHEIEVLGDQAWIRNHIDLTITPEQGAPMHRAGYTLTILRKEADGRWVLARDANLVV